MQKIALHYLVCPLCKSSFSLAGESLICRHKHKFPIINDIPRFVAQSGSQSFGLEWTKFSSMQDQYRQNFLNYVTPVKPGFFKNKLILDLGCGMGRHTFWAAKFGAKHVFGIDNSDAVNAAYVNCRDLPNATIIQADIYHLPFKQVFDWSFSIGVLHHLPDPQAGFNALVRTVKPGGLVSVWVYGKRDNFSNVYIYETVRRLTTRLPLKLILAISYPLGLIVHLINKLSLPGFAYYRQFPLIVKINDVFDVLTAPRSRYYLKEQIVDWFKSAGLKKMKVDYLRKKSLIGHGQVASAS